MDLLSAAYLLMSGYDYVKQKKDKEFTRRVAEEIVREQTNLKNLINQVEKGNVSDNTLITKLSNYLNDVKSLRSYINPTLIPKFDKITRQASDEISKASNRIDVRNSRLAQAQNMAIASTANPVRSNYIKSGADDITRLTNQIRSEDVKIPPATKMLEDFSRLDNTIQGVK